MKIRASVRKFCEKCHLIHRGKCLMLICYNQRHNKDRDN